MIVELNDEIVNDLDFELKKILNSVDNIKKMVNFCVSIKFKKERDLRKQNPYIVKSVLKNLANGYAQPEAIIMTSIEFNCSLERVKQVYNIHKRYTAPINLYAKRYTCEKLKKYGMTAKEIAKVLGISENHVFKLLKCTTIKFSS